MNSRRNILQFFGLGSLFTAAAAVTPNQARAANGMGPIPSGFGPEFPPYTRTKWEHRVFRAVLGKPNWDGKNPRAELEKILDQAALEGWEVVSMNHKYLDCEIVFRKRVLWTA